MDNIMISGLKLFAYHGVNDFEKRQGQPFILDIILSADLSAAGMSDDLSQTINYSSAVKCVKAAFLSDKFDLIERAAEVVAEALLAEFPKAVSADVTVKKPEAPIKAKFDYVAVRMVRSRK